QTAVEMSAIAESVTLIVRHTIRADPVYVQMLETKPNIVVLTNTEITALHGDKILSGIAVKNDNGEEQTMAIDGVFIEIGWLPNTEILDGFVELNDKKEVVIDLNCHTTREGVFAAGDVTSVKSKQIIIASGDGAKAALEAHEYVMKLGK
ncbi:MAG: FAD-dependent oxidoreductase, partial [Methanoregula sp.]